MSGSTHAVFNQTPPLIDYNLYETDRILREAVAREGAAHANAALAAIGLELGRGATFELGRLANQYPPVLHTHDPQGHRIDRVEFHPAWHELMRGIVSRNLHAGPWQEPGPGAHVARAAGFMLQAQLECGSLCPTTMTFGAIPALRKHAWLAEHWLPVVMSSEYDGHDAPIRQKRGGLIGMGMTEKQGGSDVRANTSHAERQADDSYRLTGHKWFFSAPQCDAHLVLAQAEAGLSCFLVPRWTPDDERNAVRLQRLKDKVGNRSNASAEVEFDAAWGQLLGEEGRGVATILEMATYTRLDCVLASAGMMRQAVVQAIHHGRHRHAFGQALIDQPLMRNVLADLALESEAATLLGLRLARAFDAAGQGVDDEIEQAFRRVMTSASKFWVCKRGSQVAAEAMEVLGGNGYVEESVLARIYREMPVNSIWEGSGNIMCLDVLRAFGKTPRMSAALLAGLEPQRGHHAAYDAAFDRLAAKLAGGGDATVQEGEARVLTWQLVALVQAALMLGSSDTAVAEAFCASRLTDAAPVFGMLASRHDLQSVLQRAWSGDLG